MGDKEVVGWSILLGTLAVPPAYYFLRSPARSLSQREDSADREDDLHPLLKEHSSFRSYTTPFTTYPSIRTFYRPHAHQEKLQAIADLPLLVFIHGLGGTLPQFCPLLGSLINVAPCFGLELPGHGRSTFNPSDYSAYKIEASAALWKSAIEEVCRSNGHSKVVLICHSMGCSIAALLATDPDFEPDITGIVAICPKGSPPTPSQTKQFRRFLSLPDWTLDAFRWFDRRGGEDSASVKRFVGESAGVDTKRLQFRYNEQFKTPVWKRSALGILPKYDASGQAHGGMPGRETWSKIHTPLFLIAGEADVVTKPQEVSDIVSYLQHTPKPNGLPDSKHPVPIEADADETAQSSTEATSSDTSYSGSPSIDTKRTQHDLILKTAILPAPASHALLYDHATYRTLAGLIEDFLATHISPHLSLGWQLQQLTTSGKWDVKNLEKWKRTRAVSGSIQNNLFRALKTLREQDEVHTPKKFLETWKDWVYAVVDISRDAPIYDTKVLEKGGVEYHKFPTVSKVPPTVTEVKDFISLIERLRSEMEAKGPEQSKKAIGVHCHYGYNRTGFFIVSYLIEKKKMDVEHAIEEFKRAKPPGIKHDHFIDTLYVRYCVGLRKAPTMRVEEMSDE
jgi:pimeloyl-ACP methyl ester carboxylesterase/protein-tyrosine phosphatase